MDLKGKHFLKLLDFTPEEIEGLLSLAAELKAKKKEYYHEAAVKAAIEKRKQSL